MSVQLVRAAEGVSLQPLSVINAPDVNSSKLSCSSACYFYLTCSSFFYRDDGSCVLTQNVYTLQELDYSEPVWEYFVWTTDGCPDSYTWNRGLQLCYKVYTMGETWQAADDQCVQDGGHLITVDTPHLNSWINEQTDIHGISLWIGAILLSQDIWVWRAGNTTVLPYWDEGQPDGYHLGENCICVYNPSSNQFKFHDVPCSWNTGYVCQINTSSQMCS